MGRIGTIFLVFMLIMISGCQWFNQEESPPPDVDDVPGPLPVQPPFQHKEPKNVVVLGLEGHEQEVELKFFSNEWIRLEYDTRLSVIDEDDLLLFRSGEDEARFSVQPMDDDLLKREQSRLEKEGYELYNTFELDDPRLDLGQGFIYYLYDVRHQVELYALNQREMSVLVRFEFYESVAEEYMFVFDYMLSSIQLVDGKREGEATDENEKEAVGGR